MNECTEFLAMIDFRIFDIAMRKIALLLTLLTISIHGFAQNFNRPIPENVFPYEYNEVTGITSGYMLATHLKLWSNANNDPNYISPYAGVYDSDGYLLWYGSPGANGMADFKYYSSINQYSLTVRQLGNMNTIILDENFEPIDTLVPQNNEQDIHDVQLLDNGNWLLSTITWDTTDLSAYTFDGTQGSTQTVLRGYGYEEIDPSGTVIGEWNSNDHIHPTETYDFWGYDASDFDYCHGNAYEEDSDGNILVSHRHLNSIHKINRQTGNIIWRLGGELSDFTFPNDGAFSGQHDIRRLPNGDYSLFDNGNMTGTTRGITYTLDTINWTATKSSVYMYPSNFNANAMGSYRILDDGREILGYGLVQRPFPSSVIIDANDVILAEYYFRDSVVSYRTLLEDITPPQRPEITCHFTGAGWELSLTTMHNDYAWSTGETTPTIELMQAGTYQVWVDQGMGMIGSIPFEVADINNPPCTANIDELTLEDGDFRWVNLYGQNVKNPISGRLYLKVYTSGKVEKVIFQ